MISDLINFFFQWNRSSGHWPEQNTDQPVCKRWNPLFQFTQMPNGNHRGKLTRFLQPGFLFLSLEEFLLDTISNAYYTRASQKFYNILVTWGTIRQLLLRSRWWRTILDLDMQSSPILSKSSTPHLSLCNTTSESMILGMIVEVLAIWAKLLEPAGSAIKCVFTFCTTNVFGCFRDVTTSSSS